MKRTLIAAALGLLASTSAFAQIDLSQTQSVTDPITKLKAVDWVRLMTAEIDASTVVNKPFVYVVNATGQELVDLTCDDKWQLVGSNLYKSVKANPPRLKPWRVTLISTEGFDGYCKKSLVATSDTGQQYPTKVVPAGSFDKATYLTIMP